MRVADLVKTLKYGAFSIEYKIDNKSYELWYYFYEDEDEDDRCSIAIHIGDEYKKTRNHNLINEILKNISDFNIISIMCCDKWLLCKIKEEFLFVEEIKKIYQKLGSSND